MLLAITVVILAGQNSYTSYLTSSDLYDNVMSNWQSEFLQISLYTMFGVWFRQKGSAESRNPRDPGRASDEQEMLGEHARPDSPPLLAPDGAHRAQRLQRGSTESKPVGAPHAETGA